MLVSRWRHLWSTPGAYALVRLREDAPYSIVSLRPLSAILIEDDDAYAAVVRLMIDAGVPVLDSLPSESENL